MKRNRRRELNTFNTDVATLIFVLSFFIFAKIEKKKVEITICSSPVPFLPFVPVVFR